MPQSLGRKRICEKEPIAVPEGNGSNCGANPVMNSSGGSSSSGKSRKRYFEIFPKNMYIKLNLIIGAPQCLISVL